MTTTTTIPQCPACMASGPDVILIAIVPFGDDPPTEAFRCDKCGTGFIFHEPHVQEEAPDVVPYTPAWRGQ